MKPTDRISKKFKNSCDVVTSLQEKKYIVVFPYSQGICSKNPSGYLNPQMVLNPM